jgi:hypothetical protein
LACNVGFAVKVCFWSPAITDRQDTRNHAQELVVIKSVKGHFRVANERDVLRRFSGRSPYIRPLLEEIVEPPEPTTIVLRHLDSHLWQASGERTLNRKELKYVSRRVLEALQVMHRDGFVHAGMMRFEVQ